MKQIRFKSLADFHKVFPDEKACHRFLALMRWNENPVCVHCGSDRKVYWLKAANRLRCADCKKDFSVRIGTIFEDSALPLLKWFIAMWLITSHKKGIASTQLAKDVGVTQKTAWFMNHPIRHAMASEDFRKPLDGIVEVDETYIGGLEGNKHESKKGRKGRGSVGKTPVLGMLDRDDGIVKTQVMNRVTSNTVHRTMTQHISDKSTIMTDESSVYRKTLLSFDGHDQVNHVQGEYVRDDVHTNTIDGFWSIMKRGIIGIYHQISEKHTHRYCEEFEYRYNTRKEHDSDRFRQVAQKLNGRLTYKTLIS